MTVPTTLVPAAVGGAVAGRVAPLGLRIWGPADLLRGLLDVAQCTGETAGDNDVLEERAML